MFEMKDIMTEVYDEFPDLEKKSIDVICKKGLTDILKLLRKDEELFVKLNIGEEIKLYRHMSKEEQQVKNTINRNKRAYGNLNKRDGHSKESN